MRNVTEARVLIACVALVSAAFTAMSGHDGWGWMIFVALVAVP